MPQTKTISTNSDKWQWRSDQNPKNLLSISRKRHASSLLTTCSTSKKEKKWKKIHRSYKLEDKSWRNGNNWLRLRGINMWKCQSLPKKHRSGGKQRKRKKGGIDHLMVENSLSWCAWQTRNIIFLFFDFGVVDWVSPDDPKLTVTTRWLHRFLLIKRVQKDSFLLKLTTLPWKLYFFHLLLPNAIIFFPPHLSLFLKSYYIKLVLFLFDHIGILNFFMSEKVYFKLELQFFSYRSQIGNLLQIFLFLSFKIIDVVFQLSDGSLEFFYLFL